LQDPSRLDPLKVTVIDISNVSGADATTHFKAGTSPAIRAFLNTFQSSAVDLLEGHRSGLIASSVVLVQSGVNIVLRPLE
jgi:hypothetical protein